VAECISLRCVLCGTDRSRRFFGLTEDGAYEPERLHEMSLRVTNIGGRGRCTVERGPLPLNLAFGLRAALKAALARVEADIVEATGEPLED
jgi:hypothetical protein